MNKLLRLSFLFLLTLFAGVTSADKQSKSLAPAVAGEKHQETLFSLGQLGSKMLNEVTLESEGISMSTLPNTVLDVPVRYNQNSEGKINWNNGTKLVFTAKDNVTGIVIEAHNAQHASADKGSYDNGVWTGSLVVGDQLTLTAVDGINISSIIVLYNGEELTVEDAEVVDVKINLNITKKSWSTIGSPTGEVVGVVSSNTPDFDHYRFDIRCEEDPDQYITFNDLPSISGNIVCTSPEMGPYDLFKGQHYVLTAYAYDSPQYGVKPVAVEVYEILGEGKSPVVYNEEIAVKKVYLKENSQGLGYNVQGTSFDIEFTAPVSYVKAYWAKGMEGSTMFAASKKNDSGTFWTITMDESVLGQEGGISVNIIAQDMEGHQLKSACENTPYGISIQIDLSDEPEDSGDEEDDQPGDGDEESLSPIKLDITKTDWSTIGSDRGEVIGTATLSDEFTFDHMEFEIRCQEDTDQYITLSNLNTNGGKIVCFCWEGGHYDLYKGYHYSLIAKGFDVPYYGVAPVAVDTFEFVGTGIEPIIYSDLECVGLALEADELLYHGYKLVAREFDVTFSAPVSRAKAWLAAGFDGSIACEINKKSEDGTVWTVVLPESVMSDEGSLNLMIQAWDTSGVLAKGWNGDHAFDFNLFLDGSAPDDLRAIRVIENVFAQQKVYNLSGQRMGAGRMKRGQVYIVNGQKIVLK